jgi:hypothetical protein
VAIRTFHLANPLQRGPGCKELQSALKKANLYHGKVDGIFGAGTAHACKTAKYRLGYPPAAVTPDGGQQLLDYLTGQERLPPTFVTRRRARGYGLTQEAKLRAKVVGNANWGVSKEPSIHYTQDQRRDDALKLPARHLPLYTDCSGFVTLCYKWAGARDPNGYGYRTLGYTGTLLEHGTTVPLYEAEVGDLIVFGNWPGKHVAMISNLANKTNPMLVSHGQEKGPLLISLNNEAAALGRVWVVKKYIGI